MRGVINEFVAQRLQVYRWCSGTQSRTSLCRDSKDLLLGILSQRIYMRFCPVRCSTRYQVSNLFTVCCSLANATKLGAPSGTRTRKILILSQTRIPIPSQGQKFGAASGLEPLRETSMRRTGPLPHTITAKLGAPNRN